MRVPRNMERERFERHFACGRFVQSRQAPESTYLSNIATSLSSMENIVQRGFTPIAVPPASSRENQTRVGIANRSTIPKPSSSEENRNTGGSGPIPEQIQNMERAPNPNYPEDRGLHLGRIG